MAKADTLRKLKLYKKNPDLIKEVSNTELADLVVVVLSAVQAIDEAIKEGRLDGYTPQPDRDYLSITSAKRLLVDEVQKIFEKHNEVLSETATELDKRVNEAIERIRDGEDGIVTDEEIERAAVLAYGMLELPDFDSLVEEKITANPESVRNALELLEDGEKLSQEAIEGLVDTLKELREIRATVQQAGGVSRNTVLQLIAENASGVTDGDKGDITVSNSGATWTIDDDTVGLDELSATGTPSTSTFLRGDNTWAVPAGSGDVSKVGTPVDNQVGVWTGDGTLEGDTALTFDTATDTLTAGIFAGAGGGLTTARIAGSTYSTVQHIQDLFHSAGWTSGGVISDNGDGTVAVTAGTGLIRATDSDVDVIYFTDFAAVNPLSLTDNDNNYIYVEYNAGAPQVVATTTERTDYNTNFLIGEVYRTGTSLHINPYVKIGVSDHASKMIRFNKEVMPYAHVSGGQISETGTINLGITAGAFWEGLSKFTTGAFDSSGADRFTYYYYNGAAWVAVTSQSQIDNLQYNNIATGLATLTANRYGVHWVYIGAEATADVYVIYGQGDYTLAQAQDAMPPGTVPEIISSHGFLIGKIIIQKSASTFTQIESTYDMGFTPAIATEHNTLSGLQGGSAGEYYHLTSAQYTVVGNTSGTNTGDVTVADSSEIDFTLTGQQISASIVAGSIDESKLDASVNASLDLADSASQPGHTHTASNITDFDTEVSNNADVAANTAARHDAVTVSDSSEIDLTLTGQQISASIVAGSIDESKLDVSVNASLDLADTSVQPNSSPTFATITANTHVNLPAQTASTVAIFDASKNVTSASTATYPSLTELTYVKGVTSAIQTQLGAKAPTASPTFTGTTTTDLVVYDAARGKVTTGGSLGAAETINFNDETNYTGTLDSNITFTFANATSGDEVTLFLSYDGSAQRTITWPTVTWLDNNSGAAPTTPTASGNVLVVTVRYVGTTFYGSATGNYAVYA